MISIRPTRVPWLTTFTSVSPPKEPTRCSSPGVNDANLLELQRALGVRVSFRGEAVTLSGAAEQIERATPVVQGLLDLARMGEPVTPEDVFRLASEGPSAELPAAPPDGKIVLPGLRRAIVAKTQGQRDYLQAIANHDIVVSIGPAGTGKTYLAVAKAVEALARKRVKRIILARPAVEAGESLGFLPGDLQAKVDPYLRPLYDALEDMMPHDKVQRALETRTIEIAPLAYMRGRTLADAFIILDEAQNATGAQMKMFLTRLGVNSKTVVTGDKTQIDLPRREDSGLVQVERYSRVSKAFRSAICTRPTSSGTGSCRNHPGVCRGSERLMARRGLPRSLSGVMVGSVADRIRFHALRWAPLLATALLTYALFPPPAGVLTRVPDVGQRSERTVLAPFPFEVRKSTEEVAREGESRALTAQPVYRFSPTAYDSSLSATREFFAELERASARDRTCSGRRCRY